MFSMDSCEHLKVELLNFLTDGGLMEVCQKLKADLLSKFSLSLNNPGSILELVRIFKEEGNLNFKHGEFDVALENYGYASLLLDFVTLEEEAVKNSFCELVFCILLNMAACFLKKKEYDNVGSPCSIVLCFDPRNVKALFGRATAAIAIGRNDLAYNDLLTASEIDPSNKEIARKLNQMKMIIINDQSHKEMERGEWSHVSENEAVGDSSIAISKKVSSLDKGSVQESSSSNKDNSVKCVNCNLSYNSNLAEPKYRFCDRRRPGSSLLISKKDFQLLANGKAIHSINPKTGSYMIIRAVTKPTMLKDRAKGRDDSSQHSSSSTAKEQINPEGMDVAIDSYSEAPYSEEAVMGDAQVFPTEGGVHYESSGFTCG